MDISDPYNITVANSISNIQPNLVEVRDSCLFIAEQTSSHIFDISNPSSPQLISNLTVGGDWSQTVDANMDYWYISFGGITYLVNINNIYNPTLEDTFFTTGSSLNSYLVNNRYLFLNYLGFMVLRNNDISLSVNEKKKTNQGETNVVVHFYPNPFNHEVNFEIYAPVLRSIQLNIFNILGQKVYSNTFLQRNKKEVIKWSSINRKGENVGSGVYLFQVIVDQEQTATGKIYMLK